MPVASRRPSLRTLVVRLPVDPDIDVDSHGALPRLRRAPAMLLVAAGGVAGSLARAGVTDAIPVAAHGWPTATLLVNTTGSFVLALLLAMLHERWPTAAWPRPLFGTGFCGGFTTFSTFAVEVTVRAGNGSPLLATAYVVLSVLLSLLAALAGVACARTAARLVDQPAWSRRVDHANRPPRGDLG